MIQIETHLVKKVAKDNIVCINCKNNIAKGKVYHHEEGVKEHLHSLIARNFCSDCYSKYGEKKLLIGKNL